MNRGWLNEKITLDYLFSHDPSNSPNSPKVYEGFGKIKDTAFLKMFASKYYPDIKIYSINPVGLKGLFKDIYTDEYKASLQSE